MSDKLIDAAEVAKHNTTESCWVILYGNVYDVTSFLPNHPGGSHVILQLAGRDATDEYDPIHPSGLLESTLPATAFLGRVDSSTIPSHSYDYSGSSTSLFNPGSAYPTSWSSPTSPSSWSSTSYPSPFASSGLNSPRKIPEKLNKDELENILNLTEFEMLAKKMLSDKAWAYYSSAGDDLLSKNRNTADYRAIVFRPRIFRDVAEVDTAGSMLGRKVSLPVYVSPAAMARLGHRDGEWGIGRACGRNGIMQLVSNSASQSVEDIVDNPYPTPMQGCYGNDGKQVWGFQLYVTTDIKKSEETLRRVERTGKYAFVALTLDAVWPGKREADERVKNAGTPEQKSAIGTGGIEKSKPEKGLARALFSGMASNMTWKETLPWLYKNTKLPVVLKGIQTWEDALIASKTEGIKGIIVSNHGGRSLDTAPSSVQVLLEIRRYAPEVFDKLEVWVDGGIKRGTDVVKALCLGAKAVGIGRAALFGLGVGGIDGVERTITILREEIETTLRLLGCRSVSELGMEYINTRALDPLIWDAGSKDELLYYKMKSKL